MPTASRFFTRLTIGVVVLASISFPLPTRGSPAGAGPSEPLRPDLKTLRPDDLVLERNSSAAQGADILRFSNEILNKGTGPMELRPEGDCDGDPATQDDRIAYQRVFEDTDSSGAFEREGGDHALEYEAGCTRFHAAHSHWHFDDFALYEVIAYNEDGTLDDDPVASTEKVGFCLVDTNRTRPDLASSPEVRHYAGTCMADEATGISIGWSDLYAYWLPHQWIDVTGVPLGTYCLRSTADPENHLIEAKDGNNSRSIRVRLRAKRVEYSPRRRCLAP
ncbi:MAG: lysyl oxidase family protein [Actinomycetota bacterium]|nr:lysyl oxidase family protein [Actinomycetota bacterium]